MKTADVEVGGAKKASGRIGDSDVVTKFSLLLREMHHMAPEKPVHSLVDADVTAHLMGLSPQGAVVAS